MKTISFIVCYKLIVTFYRLILLIDIFICLVVTAVCLFFIKVQYSDLFGLFKVNILVPVEREYVMTSY